MTRPWTARSDPWSASLEVDTLSPHYGSDPFAVCSREAWTTCVPHHSSSGRRCPAEEPSGKRKKKREQLNSEVTNSWQTTCSSRLAVTAKCSSFSVIPRGRGGQPGWWSSSSRTGVDTGPVSPSTDHIAPVARQISHKNTHLQVSEITRPRTTWSDPQSASLQMDTLPQRHGSGPFPVCFDDLVYRTSHRAHGAAQLKSLWVNLKKKKENCWVSTVK